MYSLGICLNCAIEVPASVTPAVPTQTISSAGMLKKAGIWVPSIMAPIISPTNATPIPIAVLAFKAACLRSR